MLRVEILLSAAIIALTVQIAWAQTSGLAKKPPVLRICSDPQNLPFSNVKGEGFENKIADLLSSELGVPLEYAWSPQTSTFVRLTLLAGRCDLIMGYGEGDRMVQNTIPYYRSAWVLVFKVGSGLDGIANLDDPRLKGKAIGVIGGAPAASVLVQNGLMSRARSYHPMDRRSEKSPAEQMIKDIEARNIDAGILWGPIGGYYTKRAEPPLAVVPLIHETKGPREAYSIGFAIRRGEPEWKDKLNQLIVEHHDKINAILFDYGVPLLDEQDRLIPGR